MSGMTRTPRWRKMSSASGVVGPFAPSSDDLRLDARRVLRGEHVLERRGDQDVARRARGPPRPWRDRVAPGKSRIDPVAAGARRPRPRSSPSGSRSRPRTRRSRRSPRRPRGRTWRRDSRRCRGPGRSRACRRGPGVRPSAFMSSATPQASRNAKNSPRPVASRRPRTPPFGDRLAGHAAEAVERAGLSAM